MVSPTHTPDKMSGEGEWLINGLLAASLVGNVLSAWVRIKGRARVNVDQPLLVEANVRYATHEEVARLEQRLTLRLDRFEENSKTEKQEIVKEIIKMREQSAQQFTDLSRALGRLEGPNLYERVSKG